MTSRALNRTGGNCNTLPTVASPDQLADTRTDGLVATSWTVAVRHQLAQDGVQHNARQAHAQSAASLRHNDVEGDEDSLFPWRHHPSDVCDRLAPVDGELQADWMPGRVELLNDEVQDRGHDELFYVGERARRLCLAVAAKQQIDDRRDQRHVELEQPHGAQRFQANRRDNGLVGHALQAFSVRHLLAALHRYLELGAQPGTERVHQVAREQIVDVAMARICSFEI